MNEDDDVVRRNLRASGGGSEHNFARVNFGGLPLYGRGRGGDRYKVVNAEESVGICGEAGNGGEREKQAKAHADSILRLEAQG